MATLPAIRQRNEAYQANIHKRGMVKPTLKKESGKYPVGPMLLGFFVFVVIGSCKTSFGVKTGNQQMSNAFRL
ncbi:ribosome associated membrane protein RAMP4-domain-containing protein [Phlyctochytrium arcticum]|nr:ribosome associated membrane protein RAMP4-domain-containing protein [Phlyctochytrium arcticum]